LLAEGAHRRPGGAGAAEGAEEQAQGLLHLLPGGPLQAVLGEQAGVDPASIRRAEELLGFHKPLPERYWDWVGGLARGDWGTSWTVASGRPVGGILALHLGNTLLLTGLATALSLGLGLALGGIAAVRRHSWVDHLATLVAVAGSCLPTSWLGLMLIVVFAVGLGWFPAGGVHPVGRSGLLDRLPHLVLPVVTLSLASVASWSRYVRSGLLETLGQEYVRTAAAKGLPPRRVVLGHAWPNALLPLITVIALDVPFLIAGATVVETVFNYPGMGRLLLTSLQLYDWPIVQAIALLLGLSVVLANLGAEVLCAVVAPRLRARVRGSG
jgi:peptide/nickel transport system permease protein